MSEKWLRITHSILANDGRTPALLPALICLMYAGFAKKYCTLLERYKWKIVAKAIWRHIFQSLSLVIQRYYPTLTLVPRISPPNLRDVIKVYPSETGQYLWEHGTGKSVTGPPLLFSNKEKLLFIVTAQKLRTWEVLSSIEAWMSLVFDAISWITFWVLTLRDILDRRLFWPRKIQFPVPYSHEYWMVPYCYKGCPFSSFCSHVDDIENHCIN